jgi:hypothetical protein
MVADVRPHLGGLSWTPPPNRGGLSGRVLGRPVLGRSSRPARRSSTKRLRHFDTIWRVVSNRSAISSLVRPSEARSTILARTTKKYADVYRLLLASSSLRSVGVSTTAYGLLLPIAGPLPLGSARPHAQLGSDGITPSYFSRKKRPKWVLTLVSDLVLSDVLFDRSASRQLIRT